jgi:DNA-binding transcriptional ArsR family regulator
LESEFKPIKQHRLWWEKTILSKIRKNDRINVYFSSNASGNHYFLIAQFWHLAQLSKLGNIHYYIVVNDQILDETKNNVSINNSSGASLADTKSILAHFGIKPENINEYYYSDCLKKLFTLIPSTPFLFSKALRLISNKSLIIPKTNSDYEYMTSGTSYPPAYYVPKIIDLFIAQNFRSLHPEDIDGGIDIFVTSAFGEPFISKAYSVFVENRLIMNLKPIIISIPKIPFFGHNFEVYPKHITPNIKMNLEDIYESIIIYNVSEKHMVDLLEKFLMPNLNGEYIIPAEKGITREKSISLFKKLAYEKKALSLAHTFFEFFKQIKGLSKTEEQQDYILIKTEDELNSIKSIFSSPLTIDVLKECDGKTVSIISKKLNKHQPNISKIIQNLKKAGVVYSNKDGKIFIRARTIKICLDTISAK